MLFLLLQKTCHLPMQFIITLNHFIIITLLADMISEEKLKVTTNYFILIWFFLKKKKKETKLFF
jgi:hypothetical protein